MKKASARVETSENPPDTGGGRKAIVREPDPPEAVEEEAESSGPFPGALVMPAAESRKDRESFTRLLKKTWSRRIWSKVNARPGVDPRSVEEIVQEVLFIVSIKHNPTEPIEHAGAFVDRVIDNQFRNRHKKHKAPVQYGFDPDQSAGSTPTPESVMRRAQRREQLWGYIAHMRRSTPRLAEVIEGRDIEELTYEEIAEKVGRPISTVYRDHAAGRKELDRLAKVAAARRGGK